MCDSVVCIHSIPELPAGQGRAGQGRAGQGRAGQGRAGQGRAGQGRAGLGFCSAERYFCPARQKQQQYKVHPTECH